jgi:hypothetical protein
MINKNTSKKIVISLAVLVGVSLMLTSMLSGQNRRFPAGRRSLNDGANMGLTEISGTISDLKVEKPCSRLGGDSLLATVKSGNKSYTVHLGSGNFLKQQGITLNKNSQVTLKIRPSYRNRPGQFVAVSIMHGNKEITVSRGHARGNGFGRRGKGRRGGGRW